MQAGPHSDRNMKDTKNWLVPISRFGGGRLWIEEQGDSGSQDLVLWFNGMVFGVLFKVGMRRLCGLILENDML